MNLILGIISTAFLMLLVSVAIMMGCIVVAIKNGEDIESDEVIDKYADITTYSTLFITVLIYMIYKLGFQ